MRTSVVLASLVLACASYAASAQSQRDSPTGVGKIGFYICPSHPDIQATWPTRCPACQHVLQEAQPSTATALGALLVADRDRDRDEEERERRKREEREERAEHGYYDNGYYDNGYYEYAPYGYYPPAFPYGNTYGGWPSYDPTYGYYNPNTGFYFNPNTGYCYPNEEEEEEREREANEEARERREREEARERQRNEEARERR